jgi:lysophospholipase L1-like esterase
MASAASAELPLEPAYVNPRSGLADVAERLRTQDCAIAYMGASVTAQKDSYRHPLHRLLRGATGRDHASVPAGFGAMGSITGLFLMDRFVLPRRPTLAFVEYTTSDAAHTTPLEQLGPALEGIVGKLRDVGCEPCFLHLYRSDVDPDRAASVVAIYEAVADHHGVPSIDLAAWVRDRLASGTIELGSIIRDNTHTTSGGAAVVAEAVMDAFGILSRTAGPRGPSPALFPDSLRHGRVIDADPALLQDPGDHERGVFRLACSYVEVDSRNQFRFRLGGDLVGLLVVIGPHSGYIELDVDGESTEYLLWDEHCTYERLSSVIFTPFAPGGAEVTIRQSEKPVPGNEARSGEQAAPAPRKRLKLIGLMARS